MSQPGTSTTPAQMAEFYRELASQDMAPLWESLHTLVPKTPATPVEAAHWDYDAVVRPQLMRAGQLISAKQAERRVLILENPGLRGKASITHTLYAGLQLILPGEIAPAHLCRTSRLVNYKSGVVIIHATNGATASKLRQLAATLADGFSRRGVECSGVLVKVQPFENQSPPEMGQLKPLSDETFLKLGSLRETLPEGDLRQAIDALIQRSPKRE